MDDDGSKSLIYDEFAKAMHDFRVDLTPEEYPKLFYAFDRDGNGSVDYDEFVRAVRGNMNQSRLSIVHQAFKKLDRDGSGVVDIQDITGVYDAKNHPDVRSGKKTEEDILGQFLETFESHHNLRGGRNDRSITLEEFEEYYNNISASIDDDKYFELMITNAWKLGDQPAARPAWSSAGGYRQSQAPFATAPREEKKKETPLPPMSLDDKALFDHFRQKLAKRGIRGMTGLQRNFKIQDDDNSKSLDTNEFKKAVKDFRIMIHEKDAERLFKLFDRDGSGRVDYDEFLRGVRVSFPRSLTT